MDQTIINQAKSCLNTLRGNTVFMCSAQKRAEVIDNAKYQLRSWMSNGDLRPEDIGTSKEELNRLYQFS